MPQGKGTYGSKVGRPKTKEGKLEAKRMQRKKSKLASKQTRKYWNNRYEEGS